MNDEQSRSVEQLRAELQEVRAHLDDLEKRLNRLSATASPPALDPVKAPSASR